MGPPKSAPFACRGSGAADMAKARKWKGGDASEVSRWDLDENEAIAQPHSYRLDYDDDDAHSPLLLWAPSRGWNTPHVPIILWWDLELSGCTGGGEG